MSSAPQGPPARRVDTVQGLQLPSSPPSPADREARKDVEPGSRRLGAGPITGGPSRTRPEAWPDHGRKRDVVTGQRGTVCLWSSASQCAACVCHSVMMEHWDGGFTGCARATDDSAQIHSSRSALFSEGNGRLAIDISPVLSQANNLVSAPPLHACMSPNKTYKPRKHCQHQNLQTPMVRHGTTHTNTVSTNTANWHWCACNWHVDIWRHTGVTATGQQHTEIKSSCTATGAPL